MKGNSSELRFLEPTARAFAEALRDNPPLNGPVYLVGHGELADTIVRDAANEGVSVIAHADIPPMEVLKQARVLLFTETRGEQLGDLLLACLDLQQVRIFAPKSDWHMSRKPLFIVSIPKAGTHLAYEFARALGYAAGIQIPDFPKPGTWYCIEYSNSHTVARDFFIDSVRRAPFGNRHHPVTQSPVLFVYRHPLDILVSEAHYYHREGKTVFAGYFSGEDFEHRVRQLVDDEWLLGSLRQRVGGFLPWLNFPNVIPVAFEELVGGAGGGSARAQLKSIWAIQLKLQADGITKDIAAQVFNQNSATFREGRIGGYLSQLPSNLIDELADQCADVLSGFGYTVRGDSLIPSRVAEFQSRPLRYSSKDFNEMPLTVEQDFMGCNLVRYTRRFYAVPLSAGVIALDECAPQQLARLPSATTLAELKSVLLIGRKAYDRQLAQLNHTGLELYSNTANNVSLAYWMESEEPCLFDAYKGFNLVAWKGRYFALRQSVGTINLAQNLQTLLTLYTPDAILMARDVDTLMDDIDGISTAVRLTNNLNGNIAGLQAQLDDCARSIQTQSEQLQLQNVYDMARLYGEKIEGSLQALSLQIEDSVVKGLQHTLTSIIQQHVYDMSRLYGEKIEGSLQGLSLQIEGSVVKSLQNTLTSIIQQHAGLQGELHKQEERIMDLNNKLNIRNASFLSRLFRRKP
ncbi:hypothetical protein ACH5Y9_18140 [Methylomonas sp. BW4-1]|uniref:hypothetical protein n=1 Tax=Methylomonas sp. BW4-1 TaxID=3376685 RepID=UPI004042B593